MAGYVIHLAVAEEYLRKHDNNEKYDEFIQGVIFPDGVEDKSRTHYGKNSSHVNLVDFLSENNLDTSFKRGYFLHLFTDYLFYNKYIDTFSKDIYNDYDLLNKELMKKYNVMLPSEIKNKVFFKSQGNLKILTVELMKRVIDEISEYDIDSTKKEILENPKKWSKYRELKRI